MNNVVECTCSPSVEDELEVPTASVVVNSTPLDSVVTIIPDV